MCSSLLQSFSCILPELSLHAIVALCSVSYSSHDLFEFDSPVQGLLGTHAVQSPLRVSAQACDVMNCRTPPAARKAALFQPDLANAALACYAIQDEQHEAPKS